MNEGMIRRMKKHELKKPPVGWDFHPTHGFGRSLVPEDENRSKIDTGNGRSWRLRCRRVFFPRVIHKLHTPEGSERPTFVVFEGRRVPVEPGSEMGRARSPRDNRT